MYDEENLLYSPKDVFVQQNFHTPIKGIDGTMFYNTENKFDFNRPAKTPPRIQLEGIKVPIRSNSSRLSDEKV